ncbi:unnamed protein product [Soboliphyme baturini]|uniref:PIGO_PIGG domain-containing protein n=1 Tax=Soboliphyme baturini TaxID=241478 RepID=A0A183J8L6_9BILA|nr:unnamed protein product [Soboliphyme baturini]
MLIAPRMAAVVVAVLLLSSQTASRASLLSASSMIIALLLTRLEMTIVLFVSVVQEVLLNRLCHLLELSLYDRVVLYYLLAGTLYFFKGSTNSLGTVDFSAAYTGLASYQPLIIMMNIIASIYCCSFWIWTAFLRRTSQSTRWSGICCVLFLRSLSITMCLLFTIILRYHAFIWSVFIPKLLYECCHTAVTSFVVFLATVLWQPSNTVDECLGLKVKAEL